ncbi:MAG TPA: PEP-CTERM sorting domain-containing protein [Lacipirellulaceae bacterium]|nr:PEP-CTERM sorting domain-containing protein [Lacipirellulaceae bacterium]
MGDYYQLQTSTTGASTIGIQFDQVSSTTGPRDWKIQYSTDGSSFTDFGTYKVAPNGVPSWSSVAAVTPIGLDTYSFDFSSITALNNQANIYLRLSDTSTSAANNTGTVATAGTDRIDNFSIYKNFDKTQSPIIQPPAAPVLPQGNDVVVGYDGNRGNATLDLVRGTATTNGGSKPATYAPWQNTPFVGSSMAFDNLGGTAHNVHGNLLSTDFGGSSPSSGGRIVNLATTGSAPFASSQVLYSSTTNRLGQLSVSPSNNKVAVADADDGQVTVWDYTAGNTQGGGASLTGIRQTTAQPLVTSVATTAGSPPSTTYTQQQQGVTWIDNNTVLSFSSAGNLSETNATTMATTAKGSVTPATPSPVLTSSTTALYYNTAISPYVWALYGGLSPALGNSINTLYVLDPANNYNVLHSVDLSGTTPNSGASKGITTPAGAVPTATGLAFDSAGNLYLAGNQSIVSVIPNAAAQALTLPNLSALRWFTGNFVNFPGIEVGLASAVAPGVSGDYNGNGVVDMADYVLWRNGGPLLNDPTPGVQASDYDYWRSRFGATSGSGSGLGSAAVPEPASALLMLLGLAAFGCKRRS